MTAQPERRSQVFLLAVGGFFLVVFALPLFLDPYWWAAAERDPHTDVATYFGRCLGAVGVALSGTALWAAREPRRYRSLFTVLGIAAALLAVVHLRGAVEDSQPLVEHLETLGYAAFAGFAFSCTLAGLRNRGIATRASPSGLASAPAG